MLYLIFGLLVWVAATGDIWAWVMAHQLTVAYVVAVLIERLPPPTNNSSQLYAYIYSVLQVFAANSKRAQDAVKAAQTPADVQKP